MFGGGGMFGTKAKAGAEKGAEAGGAKPAAAGAGAAGASGAPGGSESDCFTKTTEQLVAAAKTPEQKKILNEIIEAAAKAGASGPNKDDAKPKGGGVFGWVKDKAKAGYEMGKAALTDLGAKASKAMSGKGASRGDFIEQKV